MRKQVSWKGVVTKENTKEALRLLPAATSITLPLDPCNANGLAGPFYLFDDLNSYCQVSRMTHAMARVNKALCEQPGRSPCSVPIVLVSPSKQHSSIKNTRVGLWEKKDPKGG